MLMWRWLLIRRHYVVWICCSSHGWHVTGRRRSRRGLRGVSSTDACGWGYRVRSEVKLVIHQERLRSAQVVCSHFGWVVTGNIAWNHRRRWMVVSGTWPNWWRAVHAGHAVVFLRGRRRAPTRRRRIRTDLSRHVLRWWRGKPGSHSRTTHHSRMWNSIGLTNNVWRRRWRWSTTIRWTGPL